MKLYFADNEEETEGFATSFFFDEGDDQEIFLAWLDKMDISYLKSKMPVVEDGKLRYQNAIIINREEEHVEEEQVEEEAPVEEEKPKETSSRKKKKSKNSLDEQQE